jgi:hypothetical protein
MLEDPVCLISYLFVDCKFRNVYCVTLIPVLLCNLHTCRYMAYIMDTNEEERSKVSSFIFYYYKMIQ